MNLTQDNSQTSNTSQQDDDDVYLQAHNLTTDMDDSKQLIAEVDAGRTAVKSEGVVVEDGGAAQTEATTSSYLGEIEIGHVDEGVSQDGSVAKQRLEGSAQLQENPDNSQDQSQNRIIPGSYDMHNQSPMQAPVQQVPPTVQDPFLMG